ncbi:MAG TPA: ABC transporter permease [Gemmataceae bacterium]|jgi:putative ABC transport system permease protein
MKMGTLKMPYSLATVWRQPLRYLPAVFAVAFSAVLSTLQCGLLVGILNIAARPIRRSEADVWLASPGVRGMGFGRPIPLAWKARLLSQPEVRRVEEYLCGFTQFQRPDGSTDQCSVVGMRLETGSLGALKDLTAEMRQNLTRPGTAVVYGSEAPLMGLRDTPGEVGEVAGHRVEIVGVLRGGEGAGLTPGLYCSLRTARGLLADVSSRQTSYLLAQCHSPEDASRLVRRLQASYPDMDAMTSAELAWRTQRHWLIKTRAGLVLGFAAALGLFVGAVVTSQTLYGATVASLREYAVLRALGIPRWRLRRLVLGQSFWVTLAGLTLALPLTVILARIARPMNVEVLLPLWLLAGVGGLTLAVGLVSGTAALRSLRLADPATLLR